MEPMMAETLLLVDGHSIAFRAFFALPDSLRDPAGEPVHAIYGFLSILFRQVAELRPELVAVVFDEGRPFREEIYPAYKEGRQEIDPDVQRQVTRLRGVLEALEMPVFLADGFEADDVIATLARQAHDLGLETIVLSGDRDLFGIIGPRTTILYPTRSMKEAERYDAARLRARWGIEPAQVADWKALVGDPSDNIPGVRGVGEKGATKLLAEYGTLGGIYDNLEAITAKRTRGALADGREDAWLSLRLARLIDDVPGVVLDPAACEVRYARERVEDAFDHLGFRSLRDRLP
jgi:DNA polymerase I